MNRAREKSRENNMDHPLFGPWYVQSMVQVLQYVERINIAWQRFDYLGFSATWPDHQPGQINSRGIVNNFRKSCRSSVNHSPSLCHWELLTREKHVGLNILETCLILRLNTHGLSKSARQIFPEKSWKSAVGTHMWCLMELGGFSGIPGHKRYENGQRPKKYACWKF